jgi:hypothetical protein
MLGVEIIGFFEDGKNNETSFWAFTHVFGKCIIFYAEYKIAFWEPGKSVLRPSDTWYGILRAW